jgi:hypothetical protein
MCFLYKLIDPRILRPIPTIENWAAAGIYYGMASYESRPLDHLHSASVAIENDLDLMPDFKEV